MSERYHEQDDKRTFDTELKSRVFTLSIGDYVYNEEKKELLFLDGLASFLDEEWRITPLDIWGERIRVYKPRFVGFSDYSGEPMWDITGCLYKIEIEKISLVKKSVRNMIKELRRDCKSYLEYLINDIKIVVLGEKVEKHTPTSLKI